jgi:DNA-binding LacI/PurR family transcriptional regulator
VPDFSILSPSQQVANHLRQELLQRRWSNTMPGGPALSVELGVDPKTVGLALTILEQEGLLKGQGAGRPRKITFPQDQLQSTFRIGLLDWGKNSRDRRLTEDLKQSPYKIVIAPKTMGDLNMELKRIKRLVESVDVDAWIIYSGSREILEWFSEQPLPAFAMFGYMSKLPIAGAGPHSPSGYAESVRALSALGHQRIVMLTPRFTRHPEPNRAVQAFLNSLEAEDIRTGPYNLPDWDPEGGGLHAMLDSLFKITPPSVLIINDKVNFFAVQQFLLERGIRVPADVSLVCHEHLNALTWCDNPVAYIHWDWAPISRRLRSWMKNASLQKSDTRQHFVKPRFLPGRTLGPPAP